MTRCHQPPGASTYWPQMNFLDCCSRPLQRSRRSFLTDSAPTPELAPLHPLPPLCLSPRNFFQNGLHLLSPNCFLKRACQPQNRKHVFSISPAAGGLGCTPQNLLLLWLVYGSNHPPPFFFQESFQPWEYFVWQSLINSLNVIIWKKWI